MAAVQYRTGSSINTYIPNTCIFCHQKDINKEGSYDLFVCLLCCILIIGDDLPEWDTYKAYSRYGCDLCCQDEFNWDTPHRTKFEFKSCKECHKKYFGIMTENKQFNDIKQLLIDFKDSLVNMD